MNPKLIRLITSNHQKTKRNYLKRMISNKIRTMKISKTYGREYWDGKREYGYGGYRYDGRWISIAKKLIKKYKLNSNSKILDIGCGKGFLVYDLSKLLNSQSVYGIDLSRYAIKNSIRKVKQNLKVFDARKNLNFKKNEFDLIISINLIHNFTIFEINNFLKKICHISKSSYITTESYRNNKELFNLQCWALTCESFFSAAEWKWIFKENSYFRDYELIYFT